MARRKAGSGSGEDVAVGELYLGDFEGFVGRRSELAKQLRARGDGEGADRVRALKKPGVWLGRSISSAAMTRPCETSFSARGRPYAKRTRLFATQVVLDADEPGP